MTVAVANEGLVWDSLVKTFHVILVVTGILGAGGRSKIYPSPLDQMFRTEWWCIAWTILREMGPLPPIRPWRQPTPCHRWWERQHQLRIQAFLFSSKNGGVWVVLVKAIGYLFWTFCRIRGPIWRKRPGIIQKPSKTYTVVELYNGTNYGKSTHQLVNQIELFIDSSTRVVQKL